MSPVRQAGPAKQYRGRGWPGRRKSIHGRYRSGKVIQIHVGEAAQLARESDPADAGPGECERRCRNESGPAARTPGPRFPGRRKVLERRLWPGGCRRGTLVGSTSTRPRTDPRGRRSRGLLRQSGAPRTDGQTAIAPSVKTSLGLHAGSTDRADARRSAQRGSRAARAHVLWLRLGKWRRGLKISTSPSVPSLLPYDSAPIRLRGAKREGCRKRQGATRQPIPSSPRHTRLPRLRPLPCSRSFPANQRNARLAES